MFEVQLQVHGQRAVQRRLEGVRRAALGWRKARPGIAQALSREMDKFPIPVLTGWLRGSLTRPGHPDQICDVRGTKILFGTRVSYAPTRLGMLPRPALGGLVLVLEEHIERNIKSRGGA